jgi:hypothetical protein
VPVNTLKTHRSCWTQFEEFCSQRGYSLDQVLPIEELNNILKDCGFNMKKKSGEDYKETVVKVLWNTTAKALQEMYYNKSLYSICEWNDSGRNFLSAIAPLFCFLPFLSFQ